MWNEAAALWHNNLHKCHSLALRHSSCLISVPLLINSLILVHIKTSAWDILQHNPYIISDDQQQYTLHRSPVHLFIYLWFALICASHQKQHYFINNQQIATPQRGASVVSFRTIVALYQMKQANTDVTTSHNGIILIITRCLKCMR